MENYALTEDQIAAFCQHLLQEERAAGTLEKCLRDLQAFSRWLDGRPVTKETVTHHCKSYMLPWKFPLHILTFAFNSDKIDWTIQ